MTTPSPAPVSTPTPVDSLPTVPSKAGLGARLKRHWLPYAAGAALVAGGFFAWHRLHPPVRYDNQAQISLGVPDVWVHSQNLAHLPHDLLQEPLLKSVLTEDFLYFYQQDPDWMSLQGAVRRISFEHDLNWSDQLIAHIGDAPADVYLWRDGTHALRYWALSMQRDYLLNAAQQLAQLKFAADRQITEVGHVNIDGDQVAILKLNLSSKRNMVLVTHGNRLVLLSDASMISRDQGALDEHAEGLLKALLNKDSAGRDALVTDARPANSKAAEQSIWMSNRFFAQGYGAFLPDLQALRFDYDGTHWQTAANGPQVQADPRIWTALPGYAAFCASTSVDWSQVQGALKEIKAPVGAAVDAAAWQGVSPTGAVCWYTQKDGDAAADQPLMAEPIFVALKKDASALPADTLQKLFDWGISHNRDYEKPLLELKAKARGLAANLKDNDTRQKDLRKTPDETGMSDADRATAASDRKNQLDQAKADAERMAQDLADVRKQVKDMKTTLAPQIATANALTVHQQDGFTTVTRTQAILPSKQTNPMLAFNDQVIYFSPNSRLVARAMAVSHQRYPNLAEQAARVIHPDQVTVLYANPAKLSELTMQVGHQALTEDQSRLRAAFDYHMPARMSALAAQPPFAASLPRLGGGTAASAPATTASAGSSNASSPIQWQTVTWSQP